jgi:hypothetical protein
VGIMSDEVGRDEGKKGKKNKSAPDHRCRPDPASVPTLALKRPPFPLHTCKCR